MDDYEVIELFVTHLRNHGFPGLQVERHPDKENPGIPDIDAIAGTFAIEHTSIDTLVNQRRDSDWFTQAVGSLEKEISEEISYYLSITLSYDAIKKGQSWAAIRDVLKGWIMSEAPKLADVKQTIDDIPSIPFQLHVIKRSDWRPGLFFARYEPKDETLPSRIRELFDRKLEKLEKYRGPGCTTVLLVENNDIALMNEWKMLESIKHAYPNDLPCGVDEIWYADTSVPSEILFNNFTSDLC